MCAYATQRVYKVKQRCRTILNLEEKMRWSLRQADLFNVITYYVKSGTRIENRRTFMFIKHIHFFMTDRFVTSNNNNNFLFWKK